MPASPHIPILRLGEPYISLDTRDVVALHDGQTVATLSIANAGLIHRDASQLPAAREALSQFTTQEIMARCADAAERFMHGELPLGETNQSPDDYISQLSLTSGLPHTLVRRNMAKLYDAMTHLGDILAGLTRGLPMSVFDEGCGDASGIDVSFYPTTTALGCVMPSNSPGVNALWLPSLALKTPVVLRSGKDEPWTPYRLIQAMIAAGLPREAFGFYPSEHDGADAVLDVCDRSIIFGGADTARRYHGNPRVEVHGPGWSKLLLADDSADAWEDHLNIMVQSIAGNSGRSCINASTIFIPRHGKALAEALAARLAEITPLKADEESAQLSAIANPAVAQWADGRIADDLQVPGASDQTSECRGNTPRVVERDGLTYLLPTLIHCDSIEHPLAKREFMFPFASVVELPQEQMIGNLGPTLVLTAITQDQAFTRELLACPDIQRLNLGPLPTSVARWDQPHEGNLFELLYHRRAIQRAEPVA